MFTIPLWTIVVFFCSTTTMHTVTWMHISGIKAFCYRRLWNIKENISHLYLIWFSQGKPGSAALSQACQSLRCSNPGHATDQVTITHHTAKVFRNPLSGEELDTVWMSLDCIDQTCVITFSTLMFVLTFWELKLKPILFDLNVVCQMAVQYGLNI